MSKRLLVGISVILLTVNVWAIDCQHVLKEMKLVQLDPFSLPSGGKGARSIASVDSSASNSTDLAAKKKRIALMKNFLETAPLESQKSLATLMVNYFLDERVGKTGNLLDGMDLLTQNNAKNSKTVIIKPNDPTNQISSYLSRATSEDLNDVKGLTVYFLKAKNLNVDPAKVLDFLMAQIQQGNQHFAILQKNCVAGDPTLDMVATQ